ncbi:hypothetical protein NDK50_12365 [Paraburkholderia bryophila]|uniref:hypothetical protein n=1 Tax=Paraburkholderia bryophila TaxID=420952 RepID=UPI002349EC2F|nr:hypothetical protein [Paraburkholderia bryophila]WCM18264.1 hypothetical protein NDK50_12365 [Paraburkholderia bryophila]
MINDHLVKAIVDIAMFLEFTDENLLDADAAIRAMEQLADELQKMPADGKDVFIRCCHDLAGRYGNKRQFVENLPEALGIG